MSEKKQQNKEDELWNPNSFVQSISKEEASSKMNTFHKKHNEEMNFNCRKCNKVISAHNKDWHDEMCDDCFNKNYFPY